MIAIIISKLQTKTIIYYWFKYLLPTRSLYGRPYQSNVCPAKGQCVRMFENKYSKYLNFFKLYLTMMQRRSCTSIITQYGIDENTKLQDLRVLLAQELKIGHSSINDRYGPSQVV